MRSRSFAAREVWSREMARRHPSAESNPAPNPVSWWRRPEASASFESSHSASALAAGRKLPTLPPVRVSTRTRSPSPRSRIRLVARTPGCRSTVSSADAACRRGRTCRTRFFAGGCHRTDRPRHSHKRAYAVANSPRRPWVTGCDGNLAGVSRPPARESRPRRSSSGTYSVSVRTPAGAGLRKVRMPGRRPIGHHGLELGPWEHPGPSRGDRGGCPPHAASRTNREQVIGRQRVILVAPTCPGGRTMLNGASHLLGHPELRRTNFETSSEIDNPPQVIAVRRAGARRAGVAAAGGSAWRAAAQTVSRSNISKPVIREGGPAAPPLRRGALARRHASSLHGGRAPSLLSPPPRSGRSSSLLRDSRRHRTHAREHAACLPSTPPRCSPVEVFCPR